MTASAAKVALVAVIIPCFDDGATVREAVESALAGDGSVEVVVVDDGSSDPGTARVLREIAAEDVTVLRQENVGVAAARMAGLRATTAPYVLPLDADDVLSPGAITRLVEALRAAPDAAAAWGWYERMGAEDTLQPTAPTLDAWQVSHQNDLPATALFRRAALEAVGGWRPVAGFEDWDLWMSLAERGWTGVGLDIVVYRYRRADGRRLEQDTDREAIVRADLVARHPDLLAGRSRAWRRSRAPLPLRLALPIVARLPVGIRHRRLLAGAATHLAHRRGVGLLMRRVRQQAR